MGFLEFFMISSLADQDTSRRIGLFSKSLIKKAFVRKDILGYYEVVAVRHGKETVISRTKSKDTADHLCKWAEKQ